MPKNQKLLDNKPLYAAEPAVAYGEVGLTIQKPLLTVDRNPNSPVHATQEEWWEYIHRIEEGLFYPVSKVHQRISQWLDNQKK
ncbi:hypothetical protein FACS1894182_07470 [Bacteroidia bacterium]|nr:hypothetical protein FACS1894182_07470 [Bacteroidia bacterium]